MPRQRFFLNSLTLNEKNIWIDAKRHSQVDYSDGESQELRLTQLLSTASDLSLNSSQLAGAESDWVNQYHLSAQRCQILANINLKDYNPILEVGSGCGAITRALGETNNEVHAIEGSPTRALMTRLRTKDLDNVEVIQANLNQLQLEDGHYQLILFIGVMEYAKRFSDDPNASSSQAILKLLSKAAKALTDDGIIVIAIENRVGLKYQLGAYEDHLAQPYAGIKDYRGFENTGIMTFDKNQWQTILSESGLLSRFYYPFPDYKFPTLLVHEVIEKQSRPYLANQIHSLDPISNWNAPMDEHLSWKNAFDSDSYADISNSFGIVLAKNKSSLDYVFINDWLLADDINIKKNLRLNLNTLTEKHVEKTSVDLQISRQFQHVTGDIKPLQNNLLEAISQDNSEEKFSEFLQVLYANLEGNNEIHELLDIDQLYCTANQEKLIYGKYWQTDFTVSTNFQLFHLLLGFLFKQKKRLRQRLEYEFLSIDEVLTNWFEKVSVNYAQCKANLLDQEQTHRQTVYVIANNVNNELEHLFSRKNQYNFNFVTSQLFIATTNRGFSPANSITIQQKQNGEIQRLNFENIEANTTILRFDPCDHEHGVNHYLSIKQIQLMNSNHSSLLYQGDGRLEDHLDNLQLSDMQLIHDRKCIYKINGIDPQLIFSPSKYFKNSNERYNLQITLQWLGCD